MTAAYLVRMGGVVVCPASWFPKFAILMEAFPEKIKKVDKQLAKNKDTRRARENHCMCTGDMDAGPMYHKEGKRLAMYLLWWDKPQHIA